MGWLRYGLPLEEELAVEAEIRQIRTCQDIEQLRHLAEQAFRAWTLQVDITGQLIDQLGAAEQKLQGPGSRAPIEDWIWEAARELSHATASPSGRPDTCPSPHSCAPVSPPSG